MDNINLADLDLMYDVSSYADARRLASFLVTKYRKGVEAAGINSSKEAAETILRRECETRASRGCPLVNDAAGPAEDVAAAGDSSSPQTEVEQRVMQHIEWALGARSASADDLPPPPRPAAAAAAVAAAAAAESSSAAAAAPPAEEERNGRALTREEREMFVNWQSKASCAHTGGGGGGAAAAAALVSPDSGISFASTSAPTLTAHPFKPELRLAADGGAEGAPAGGPEAQQQQAHEPEHSADASTMGLFHRQHNEMKSAVAQALQNQKAAQAAQAGGAAAVAQHLSQQAASGTAQNPDFADTESQMPDPFPASAAAASEHTAQQQQQLPQAPLSAQESAHHQQPQQQQQQVPQDMEAKREEMRKVIDELLAPAQAAAAPAAASVPASEAAPVAAAAAAPSVVAAPLPPVSFPNPPLPTVASSLMHPVVPAAKPPTGAGSYYWETYDRYSKNMR